MPRTKGVTKKKVVAKKEPTNGNRARFVPTGSTLLNLACSDRSQGGWSLGKVVNIIGDSSSGKTLLALTMLAEMATRPKYNKYSLIYDDVEAACEFDLTHLFGSKTAKRVAPPGGYDEEKKPIYSDTIEDFQDSIITRLDNNEPFVYVLDSFDALDTDADREKTDEGIEARRKGKDTSGSYGMAKAKKISEILKHIVSPLSHADSLLCIISQTRDNINPMSFVKKVRSGGRALLFYSTHEVWTAITGKIKKKNRIIGINCKCKVSKNKITGKVREVEFPIYYDIGVDDIGSCIDFLIKEGAWAKRGQKIVAGEFGTLTRDKLIQTIEQTNAEPQLRSLVAATWTELEDGLKLNRKRRFGV